MKAQSILFLLQNNLLKTENLKIDISDGFTPYGGFGKSTAEYLSAEIKIGNTNKLKNFEKLRSEYIEISQQSGAEVSGLDLAIQYFGHVTHYDSQTQQYTSNDWAYPEYDFLLVSTGTKVKTHEHIQTLSKKDLLELIPVSEHVIASYLKSNINEFIVGLKTWSKHLEQLGYLTQQSSELKSTLESHPDILCVKPCGAMGADVLFVLCDKEKTKNVQKKISELNLKIQATSEDLMAGVQALNIFENKTNDLRPYVG